MRPTRYQHWVKLSHTQKVRLYVIVAAGSAGVPAGNDHSPIATRDLVSLGMVSLALGRAYSNELGREWVAEHPLPPVGEGSFNPAPARRRPGMAKVITPDEVDKIRLMVGDMTGALPSRTQMAEAVAAGGFEVAA